MTYVDSSVVLRVLLRQRGALPSWRLLRGGLTSRLTEVECMRTSDRLMVQGRLSPTAATTLRESIHRVLESIEVLEVTRSVLSLAAQPLPTALGTLDAVHLASALAWRRRTGEALTLATHDEELALAARAQGLTVVGT